MISQQKLVTILQNPGEYRVQISVFVLWLFMVSAIVGISLGFESFFVPKTPLNLLVQTALFFWVANFKTVKVLVAAIAIFSLGIGIEWIGIHYGFPFGEYSYGENLGYKLDGVPFLIGTNWLLLSWTCHSIMESTKLHRMLKALLASAAMVLFDFPMEVVAPIFDFWTFEPAPPWNNYFAWGLVALVMQFVIQSTKERINVKFASHYMFLQMLFFSYFAYVYF